VVLVLHAPHPEAGGLLSLRKLREHYMSSWEIPALCCGPAVFLGARAHQRHRPHTAPPAALCCSAQQRMCGGDDGEGAKQRGKRKRVMTLLSNVVAGERKEGCGLLGVN